MTSNGYINEQMLEMDDLPNVSHPTVTVLGTGDFGKALTQRLSLVGYEVVIGSRSPEKRRLSLPLNYHVLPVDEAINHSEIIFFAIPPDGYDQMVQSLNTRLKNKVIVDVSNRTQAFSHGPSNAEYLASLAPGARVVKGFNVISAWTLEKDIYGGSRMVYLCGDDSQAKEKVCLFSSDHRFIVIFFDSSVLFY